MHLLDCCLIRFVSMDPVWMVYDKNFITRRHLYSILMAVNMVENSWSNTEFHMLWNHVIRIWIINEMMRCRNGSRQKKLWVKNVRFCIRWGQCRSIWQDSHIRYMMVFSPEHIRDFLRGFAEAAIIIQIASLFRKRHSLKLRKCQSDTIWKVCQCCSKYVTLHA